MKIIVAVACYTNQKEWITTVFLTQRGSKDSQQFLYGAIRVSNTAPKLYHDISILLFHWTTVSYDRLPNL